MKIEALILDYGGVVIHEDPSDYDGVGLTLGLAEGELWTLVHSIPEYLPSRIGTLSGDEFQQAVRKHLCRVAEPAAVDAAIATLVDYYRSNEAMRDVMRPLLVAVRGRAKLALLSNASRGSTLRFEQRGLLDYFDAILCSGDLGVAKPDPEAFRLAARRLSLPPERCGFVDDVESNIEAARALGMHVVHYHHSRHAGFVDTLRGWQLLD